MNKTRTVHNTFVSSRWVSVRQPPDEEGFLGVSWWVEVVWTGKTEKASVSDWGKYSGLETKIYSTEHLFIHQATYYL